MEMPNDQIPQEDFDLLTRFLIWLAGGDTELLKRCPRRDVSNVCAVAWLMLGTVAYQTGLFSVIGHTLFASQGQIRPSIILVSLAVATFIMLIDSYVVMRAGWHVEGLKELARGGLDISGGALPRIKATLFLIIRICVLSVGLAQITALFVSLIVFSGDIRSRIEIKYLLANANLIAQVTNLIDAGIKRETDAVNTQTAQVVALTAQVESLRQNVIDPATHDHLIQQAEREVQQLVDGKAKAEDELRSAEAFGTSELAGIRIAPANSGVAGAGPRYRAAMEQLTSARAHLQEIENELSAARARLEALRKQLSSVNEGVMLRSHDQLPSVEEALKAETAKLTSLKNSLADLIRNREQAIRKAVEADPKHVGYDDGFLAQLRTLEEIAHEDTKIALVIGLIDVVSFGLELAAVLAKVFGCAPTTFAALLARDTYMSAVEIVDDMMIKLKRANNEEGGTPVPVPPDDPSDGGNGFASVMVPISSEDDDEPPPQPPKRPRGRPRKYPNLAVVKDSNERKDSGPPPEQPARP
jgi:hypothetical protein